MSGSRQPLAARLCEFVQSGSDADVSRIRPLELAELWQVEGRELLAVCLSAVVSGLLDLRWDLVCPSCRTANDRQTTLSELPTSGHCQLCDLSYEIELDRAVEATFLPAPALRRAEAGPFCIGGPMRTPHVIAQAILDYFGQTVNIAARLQGASGPGEVVIDGLFADEAERAGWLSGFAISEHFDARLKGLPDPVRVARIVADRA